MGEEEKKVEETAEPTEQQSSGLLKFTYKRSNFYREILVDGAFGSLTPSFDIHLSLYNQHYGELKEQLFHLNSDGTLGTEIKTDEIKSQEIYREIEAGLTMNVGTAISLIRWLTGQVREAQKAMGIDALQEGSDGK